jgi:hypothetical protein
MQTCCAVYSVFLKSDQDVNARTLLYFQKLLVDSLLDYCAARKEDFSDDVNFLKARISEYDSILYQNVVNTNKAICQVKPYPLASSLPPIDYVHYGFNMVAVHSFQVVPRDCANVPPGYVR